MNARERIALHAEGSLIPRERVLEIMDEGGEGPEWGSTRDVSRVVGLSAEYWQDRARAGEIKGAFQTTEGGPWVLPLAECRAHLARRSRQRTERRSRRRGPWGIEKAS